MGCSVSKEDSFPPSPVQPAFHDGSPEPLTVEPVQKKEDFVQLVFQTKRKYVFEGENDEKYKDYNPEVLPKSDAEAKKISENCCT